MFLRGLVAFLALLTAARCFAAEAKGFVRLESCPVYRLLEADGLHLTSLDGRRPAKPVVLRFPTEGAWYNVLNSWIDTSSDYCPGDNCEAVVHAKFRIQHISKGIILPFRGRRIHGVSGDLVIEFSDGRRFEGPFRANVRKSVTELICE